MHEGDRPLVIDSGQCDEASHNGCSQPAPFHRRARLPLWFKARFSTTYEDKQRNAPDVASGRATAHRRTHHGQSERKSYTPSQTTDGKESVRKSGAHPFGVQGCRIGRPRETSMRLVPVISLSGNPSCQATFWEQGCNFWVVRTPGPLIQGERSGSGDPCVRQSLLPKPGVAS